MPNWRNLFMSQPTAVRLRVENGSWHEPLICVTRDRHMDPDAREIVGVMEEGGLLVLRWTSEKAVLLLDLPTLIGTHHSGGHSGGDTWLQVLATRWRHASGVLPTDSPSPDGRNGEPMAVHRGPATWRIARSRFEATAKIEYESESRCGFVILEFYEDAPSLLASLATGNEPVSWVTVPGGSRIEIDLGDGLLMLRRHLLPRS